MESKGAENSWGAASELEDKPTVQQPFRSGRWEGREKESHLFRGAKKKRCPVQRDGWPARGEVRLAGA